MTQGTDSYMHDKAVINFIGVRWYSPTIDRLIISMAKCIANALEMVQSCTNLKRSNSIDSIDRIDWSNRLIDGFEVDWSTDRSHGFSIDRIASIDRMDRSIDWLIDWLILKPHTPVWHREPVQPGVQKHSKSGVWWVLFVQVRGCSHFQSLLPLPRHAQGLWWHAERGWEIKTEWPPFFRRHFQTYFIQRKLFYFYSNFPEICYQGSN